MKRSLAVAMAMIGLSTILAAQPGPRGEAPQDGRMKRHRANMMEMLNLTAEQETQFTKFRSEFQKSEIRTQADIRLAQIDLRSLMQADKPDKGKIAGKMKEISDLQHQQKIAWLDHTFDVQSILTPEQIATWKEHHQEVGFGMPEGCQGCQGHECGGRGWGHRFEGRMLEE